MRVLDHLLARMENHLKKEGLKKSDEAWLVVDKDQWTDEQLSQLHQWSLKADNCGFTLSNPMLSEKSIKSWLSPAVEHCGVL